MDSQPILIKIADMSQVPCGGKTIVEGPNKEKIALFNINGTIHALENSCPHMGGPLGEGDIDEGTVICPWHGWQFDIASGCCINMPGDDVRKIEIVVTGEEIFLVSSRITAPGHLD